MHHKLLIFSSYLGSGGAEKHTVRLVNSLNKDKFDITIVTPNKKGAYEKELLPHIQHISIGNSYAFHISSTFARLTCIWSLRRFIKKVKPHIVITVTDIHTLIYIVAVAGLTQKPKHIALVQNALFHLYGSSNNSIQRLIYSAIPSWYKKVNKIIALSEGVAHDLLTLAPHLQNKVEVIYNIGVDEYLKSKVQALKLDTQRPVVLACGRLVSQKGYPYLIEAFAQIVKDRPASLLILGEGEQRQAIEKLIEVHNLKHHVQLLGFHSNPYAYMASSDLFVLSSEYEGFGNVIVEAMACGTPVISTDCPHGPNEIIQQGHNGILVPVKDPDALAKAILKVLNNKNLHATLKKNGIERSKDFEAHKIAKQYEKAFYDTLSS